LENLVSYTDEINELEGIWEESAIYEKWWGMEKMGNLSFHIMLINILLIMVTW
jgi:hypothetical protein